MRFHKLHIFVRDISEWGCLFIWRFCWLWECCYWNYLFASGEHGIV